MSASEPLPNPANLAYVEALLERYLADPDAVPPAWQRFLESIHAGGDGRPPKQVGPSAWRPSLFDPAPGAARTPADARVAVSQDKVDQLIRAYRVRGHRAAQVDPLGRRRESPPELDPAFFGFGEEDLDRTFSVDTIPGEHVMRLRDILDHLRTTYCRSIGVQFMHIHDLPVRTWLRDRMEVTRNRLALAREEQVRILTRLTDALIFEEFIRKKFLGAKTFSLEGAETLIPLLDLALEKAGEDGLDEVVIGMAHRGRLNVLANIVGKSVRRIFSEFEDAEAVPGRGGDVKYHLGHSGSRKTASGRDVQVVLCFNPSHLEFVDPVALGRVRARQDRVGDLERRRGMALLVHGDAAFIGEGVVQESLNLSQLRGFTTGGTLHVVLNNQIGFTTAPEEGRSSPYATDVALMLQVPVFHVNGEDPEAAAQAVRLAMDFRREFRRDVVIDLYCYRRLGHNETDEPSFTQPVLYRAIQSRPSVREDYLRRLLEMGEVNEAEADGIAAARRDALEQALADVRKGEVGSEPLMLQGPWEGFAGGPASNLVEVATAVEDARLSELLRAQNRLPAGFHLHPKLRRLFEAREEMARGERPLDWGAAECLAYATLVTEGVKVRLSGQDTERGTFGHRHAVLHDYEDGNPYVPLRHLSPDQETFEVWNSPLSEAAALGFEYGYSLDRPAGLVLWEAQFGDFVNAAQVIVDQYLVSAEEKWHRLSGLVLLLPHGMEGQGPEHSSARLERFLQLAAKDNIQVVQPTTPAQIFHLLRRQALIRWRKPLVVMTPKSLLRLKTCASPLEDLAGGRFEKVLGDPEVEPGAVTDRILCCTGKIYYELLEERERRGRPPVPILRLEQLYPIPEDAIRKVLAPYPEVPVVWVQEEPGNMGAWRHLRVRSVERVLGRRPLRAVHRPESASPASGSAATHRAEQEILCRKAFDVT